MWKKRLKVTAAALAMGVGFVTSAEAVELTGNLESSELSLVEFEVSGQFESLLINTLGSSFDTEIGLYDSNGNLIETDDDSGQGFFSLLIVPNGHSLDGVLTLALGGYNTVFGPTLSDITPGSASGAFGLQVSTANRLTTTFSGTFPSGGILDFPVVIDPLSPSLNIDTFGSNFDTELGLYNANNSFVTSGDELGDGSGLEFISLNPQTIGNLNGTSTVQLGASPTTFGATPSETTTTSTTGGEYRLSVGRFQTRGREVRIVSISNGEVEAVTEPATILGTCVVGAVAAGSALKKKLMV